VLIVEDDVFLAESLVQMLEGTGANIVGPVDTVAGALSAVDMHHPVSVAVLDVNLGGVRTDRVAEKLMAQRTPFLFLTGNSSLLSHGIYEGVPVLQKPVERQALIDALLSIRA
jgi:CheY-like chemotaxis protein